MKALIFGISGQDGAYLSKFLLHKGYEVFGTSRDSENCRFSNLKTLGLKNQVSIFSAQPIDFHNVHQCILKVRPDEIYNLSGQSSVGLSFEQPTETFNSIVISTLNILESIRLLGLNTKFYNAGSGEMFGNQMSPCTEESPLEPCSPYGVAKSTAFMLVRSYRNAYKIHACTGILFNHESPLRPERFVTQKIVATAVRIANGSKERLQLGNIEIERDWGWAEEYVIAMWKMLQLKQPDDFIIASGTSTSLMDFIRIAFTRVGLNWEEHCEIDKKLARPSDIALSCGNAARAKEILDWNAMITGTSVASKMVEERLTLMNKIRPKD